MRWEGGGVGMHTIDVLVACVFEPEIDNLIRGCHNLCGIDIAGEGIPGVPA
jgi:hypothetical protein